MEIEIKEDQWNEEVVVLTEDTGYIIEYDDVTGDWYVFAENDSSVQDAWMETKNDAILFALERAGVIENANYQRAPDRTSA